MGRVRVVPESGCAPARVGEGRPRRGSGPRAGVPRRLTSPLPPPPPLSPNTARNRRRLVPMAAETCSAASKPGPTRSRAGPAGAADDDGAEDEAGAEGAAEAAAAPTAAAAPPLPAATAEGEGGAPGAPPPAGPGGSSRAGTRWRGAPPRPRRPPPPPPPVVPGRAGKRHRQLCAMFAP